MHKGDAAHRHARTRPRGVNSVTTEPRTRPVDISVVHLGEIQSDNASLAQISAEDSSASPALERHCPSVCEACGASTAANQYLLKLASGRNIQCVCVTARTPTVGGYDPPSSGFILLRIPPPFCIWPQQQSKWGVSSILNSRPESRYRCFETQRTAPLKLAWFGTRRALVEVHRTCPSCFQTSASNIS